MNRVEKGAHNHPVNLHQQFLFWKHGSVCDPEKGSKVWVAKSSVKKAGSFFLEREQARMPLSWVYFGCHKFWFFSRYLRLLGRLVYCKDDHSFYGTFHIHSSFIQRFAQRPRTDLNKRSLPRPKTTTGWKLIPHRFIISARIKILHGGNFLQSKMSLNVIPVKLFFY